jgi:hypothetical protein
VPLSPLPKLVKRKVTGRFFNVLKNMYANLFTFIKLSGLISKKIHVKKDTEQGHSHSPDLLKLFLNDPSPKLDNSNCRYLSGMRISHFLWAGDLILSGKTKQSAAPSPRSTKCRPLSSSRKLPFLP